MWFGKIDDPEALVQCPYNDAHMVRNKRMQYHLIDCRKQHIGCEMKTCPYNAKHVHPSMEHQFHLVHCPDRTLIDRDILYHMKEDNSYILQQTGNVSLPSYNSVPNHEISGDEDWDAEATEESFCLNDALSVRQTRQFEEPPAPAVLRTPRAEPDALSAVNQSVIEQRKQPRQANAEPSSLNVAATSSAPSNVVGRGRLFAGLAPSYTGVAIGRGRGQLLPMLSGSGVTSAIGQMGFTNGYGRGSMIALERRSYQPTSSSSQGKLSSTGQVQQQSLKSVSSAPVLGAKKTPPSLPEQPLRRATATPAFSLGPRTERIPPEANQLPMPVFQVNES